VLTFHLQQPHEGANEAKESEVATVELVIAGGNAAELFNSVKEAFDKVTVLIQMPVIVACLRAIVTRRDHRLSPGFLDALDELVRYPWPCLRPRPGLSSLPPAPMLTTLPQLEDSLHENAWPRTGQLPSEYIDPDMLW
jgi:hypothetical protein